MNKHTKSAMEWKKKNPDKVKIHKKRYWEKLKSNPISLKKLRLQTKLWRDKNKEKRLRYGIEWRKRNPEKAKMQWKRYRENHPKRSLLSKRFAIFERDKFTCQYCGRKAPEVILHVDHILPRSKGGKNVKENLITACRDCNLGKRDKMLEAKDSFNK